MPSDRPVPPPDEPRVTVKIDLQIGRWPVQAEFAIPDRPANGDVLLPIAHKLAQFVADDVEEIVKEGGRAISCKKGCGACCRQVVPIAVAEARALARLVDEMPEPRRGEIRARFAAAVTRLAQTDLLDILKIRDRKLPIPYGELGLRYFALGIACPFLEDESCSIHLVRPAACRQYLVTSPAENCADPQPGRIGGVAPPANVNQALVNADPEGRGHVQPWLPLTLALEWVAANPEPAPAIPARELLKQFLELLSGSKLPQAKSAEQRTTSMLDSAV